MVPGSASPSEPPDGGGSVPRQRWRLVLARSADAPRLAGRELAEAWEGTLEASGLPVHRGGRPRARVAFGAPLQMGIEAEAELADIVLTEFVPTWFVREALADRLPEGWRLVDLYDVWLNRPALAGQVVAADYRIDLGEADASTIDAAVAAFLRAPRLPRERLKGSATVTYDLRPLVGDVAIVDEGPPLMIRARTRFHAELGSGRPEEVVAALSDLAGAPMPIASIVRERVLLTDDLA